MAAFGSVASGHHLPKRRRKAPALSGWGYKAYFCVWTSKDRRSVLVGSIAKRGEPVMRQTAEKYRAEIIALEIMPD
jgi:REP element-mobilizing transposase RayT